jgi:hypothetical protein
VEVYAALDEPAEAKRSVDAAYREAWVDGPPYAFYHELNRIRAALQTLGLPEPQLSRVDPAHVKPVPDDAAIRAFLAELNPGTTNTPADGAVAVTAEPERETEHDPATAGNGRRPWWKVWSRK